MANTLLAAAAVICALGSTCAATAPGPPAPPLLTPAPAMDHMSIDGDDYAIPAPAGYCASAAIDAVLRPKLETITATTVNSLWIGCGFNRANPKTLVFGMAAVKPGPADESMTRAAFLQQMIAALGTPQGAALLQQGIEHSQDRASAMGMRTGNITAAPRVIGADAYAAYCIASAGLSTPNGQQGVFVIEAVTVIKGRVALLAFGKLGPTADTQALLLAQLKAEAKRFVEANEALGA